MCSETSWCSSWAFPVFHPDCFRTHQVWSDALVFYSMTFCIYHVITLNTYNLNFFQCILWENKVCLLCPWLNPFAQHCSYKMLNSIWWGHEWTHKWKESHLKAEKYRQLISLIISEDLWASQVVLVVTNKQTNKQTINQKQLTCQCRRHKRHWLSP